MFLKNNQFVMS